MDPTRSGGTILPTADSRECGARAAQAALSSPPFHLPKGSDGGGQRCFPHTNATVRGTYQTLTDTLALTVLNLGGYDYTNLGSFDVSGSSVIAMGLGFRWKLTPQASSAC